MLKGQYYQNPYIYNFLTFLKLWKDCSLRFEIARANVEEGQSVLDVCGGTGRLREFLPSGCSYACVDASSGFGPALLKQGIKYIQTDLHNGVDIKRLKSDVVIMVVSLYQFRHTSMHDLLESFKDIAKKVVIVEDVLPQGKVEKTLKKKIINYLCAVEYFQPLELFSAQEFKDVMRAHGYVCQEHGPCYVSGCFVS